MSVHLPFQSPIHYPELPPAGVLPLNIFGQRLNGLWLVEARLPAAFQNAPVVLGRTALELDFGPGYEQLEPSIIVRESHQWVGLQASQSGLQISAFTDSLHESPLLYSTASARFTLCRAGMLEAGAGLPDVGQQPGVVPAA